MEIWKSIENYEGLYEVSNLGNVKSLNYLHTNKEKILKHIDDGKGYLIVSLCKNGKAKHYYIHQLVAQTFLPNPENKPQVNHKIEGDKGKTMNIVVFNEDGLVNNEKTTIEWATAKENTNYGTRNQRANKAKSKPVLQFTLDGEFVREWESAKEAEKNGFSQGHICRCCRGQYKKHKGYIWRYK